MGVRGKVSVRYICRRERNRGIKGNTEEVGKEAGGKTVGVRGKVSVKYVSRREGTEE